MKINCSCVNGAEPRTSLPEIMSKLGGGGNLLYLILKFELN
jgi:hypothetical protein